MVNNMEIPSFSYVVAWHISMAVLQPLVVGTGDISIHRYALKPHVNIEKEYFIGWKITM